MLISLQIISVASFTLNMTDLITNDGVTRFDGIERTTVQKKKEHGAKIRYGSFSQCCGSRSGAF
jgi:hypothetical protein